MKRRDINKLFQLSLKELEAKQLELKRQFNQIKLKIKTNQEKNVHLAKSIRQDIARIKTIITKKQFTQSFQPTKPISKPKTMVKNKTSTKTTKKDLTLPKNQAKTNFKTKPSKTTQKG